MDDLARGWAMLAAVGHGRLAADLAVMIFLLAIVTIGIWVAMAQLHKRRSRELPDDMRPKPRAPLPGPDRGFRR